ncbi:KH domain RNA binding protein YlqC [Halalkalibacter wakoensis JCM 9140]|uniref:RNA-binding protein KhpA n=1 Tax=Halalkalibacter wakoensis JCM 9140 TaxID=1236970 RepID=W4PYM1_9BACI|nr:KH domain-containing protein [Halalkalibacter wakoensis]GAE24224.1 KH domain RNA binding protein YlqC [Halalkalibacter wakoensis JCM 9140]
MKALVEHIVKAIVDQPDFVQVEEVEEGQTLNLRLTVHPEDMGKVIGKQGRTVKAIRSVVYAATPSQRVRLDIVD